MTVLVTRPARDAARTIAKLAALGIDAIAAPVLEIIPVDTASIPAELAGILITSANAVSTPTGRADLNRLLPVPMLAVGDRTADAAREAGFQDVRSAGGDVADLIALVRQTVEPGVGTLVYLSGRDVAFDLDGTLRELGYSVERATVYEARPATGLPSEAREAIASGRLSAVLFHSPRSASVFREIIEHEGLLGHLSGLPAAVLSDRVAEAATISGFRHVIVAETPDEAALLRAVEELVKGRRQE